MKRMIPILLFAAIASAQTAFNAGEVSPYMLRRVGFQKYDNACKELENMLILPLGPVERRPGTRYIAEVKDSSKETRIIPFEYSKTDAYVLECGDVYIRFYRNAGQILNGGNVYEIVSVFEESELFDIQYVQLADTMYLVDGNDPPQKLTRTGHAAWTIADAAYVTGPFLDENTTATTVTPSATTGTINLNSSGEIFDSEHVGALWRIGHRRADNPLTGTIDTNESSAAIEVGGGYDYNVQGTWVGDVILEKSFDGGSNWEAVHPRNNAGAAVNEDFSGSESEDGVTYRVTGENLASGSAQYHLRVHDYINYGIVRIATYSDPNTVTATVLSTLTATTATAKWSEGAWSDFRGWPQTIEFHEQRLFYGGSTSYPQTIWATKTASGASDDYENMTAGVDDNDALSYVLPGQNPIQWMLSQTYLLIGTLSGVGRWGSADDDAPITPTQPTNYRIQARHGAAYIQAELVGDAILYIERGGRRVREFAYSLERDRFGAPDITVLASHITGDGIVDIAYQSRPNSILWCVTSDGDLPALTYERAEEVVGWSRNTTTGDFESVCVIPGSDEDEAWVVVNRTVDGSTVRYIEQFQPRDWGSDQEDCFFVDSGLSFDGGASVVITGVTRANPAVVTVSTWPVDGDSVNLADGDEVKIASVLGMTELNNNIYTIDDANVTDKTFSLDDSAAVGNIDSTGFTAYASGGTAQRFEKDFSGLTHLEGETVAVLADGDAVSNETVSSGVVSLDIWANVVHMGLPFTSQFESMPIVLQTQTGSSAGKMSRISSVLTDFKDSLGVKYGASASANQDVVFYDVTDDPGDPIPVYTGWRPLSFLHGHSRDATVYFETAQPLPFTLREINPDISITER